MTPRMAGPEQSSSSIWSKDDTSITTETDLPRSAVGKSPVGSGGVVVQITVEPPDVVGVVAVKVQHENLIPGRKEVN